MKTVFDEVRYPHVGRRLPHVVRPRVLEGVERIGREERREEGEEQNQQDRHQLHYRRETVLLQEMKHEHVSTCVLENHLQILVTSMY